MRNLALPNGNEKRHPEAETRNGNRNGKKKKQKKQVN